MKKRVLFLIHDLGPGGAEKVLVNLVNGMDREKFDISLRTLFDWGPNRQTLSPDVHYSSWISRNLPANSHWMKVWNPEQLWSKIIPEQYDIVVSFLEGPCARVIGGCPDDDTKIVDWIHITLSTEKKFLEGFRNREEAERCYDRADALVFVSGDVKDEFLKHYRPKQKTEILYNVYDTDRIHSLAAEKPVDFPIHSDFQNWCSIGKLIPRKGWKRMLNIQKRLISENVPSRFYLIGDGSQRRELEAYAKEIGVMDSVFFTGYQMNPYAYLSRCMVNVCASEAEGFSTAAVESLLVGTPVCTVDTGGMKEILGNNGEYGIVTDNDDEEMYQAVKRFLTDHEFYEYYRKKAIERGNYFDRESSIKAIENFLLEL